MNNLTSNIKGSDLSYLLNPSDKDYLAHQQDIISIYNKSVNANLNPLILLTIWGIEHGFSVDVPDGLYFGCFGEGTGFEPQLNCAIDQVFNFWMPKFSSPTFIPIVTFPDKNPTNGNCGPYTDGFIYTYEQYTPTCHYDDPTNRNARQRFTDYYRIFTGGR